MELKETSKGTLHLTVLSYLSWLTCSGNTISQLDSNIDYLKVILHLAPTTLNDIVNTQYVINKSRL